MKPFFANFLLLILMAPTAWSQSTEAPAVEVWTGTQKLGDQINPFAYAIFPDGIVLQLGVSLDNPFLKSDSDLLNPLVLPRVTAAATFVSQRIQGGDAADTIIFWHDGSIEVARIQMTANQTMTYTIRDHSDARQKGVSTTLSKKRLAGPAAAEVLRVHQALSQATAHKALLNQLEQRRIANALGNTLDRLKEIQNEEFLKRLDIILSP